MPLDLRSLLQDKPSVVGSIKWFGALRDAKWSRFGDKVITIADPGIVAGEVIAIVGESLDGLYTATPHSSDPGFFCITLPHSIQKETDKCQIATQRIWDVFDPNALSTRDQLRIREINLNDRPKLDDEVSALSLALTDLMLNATAEPLRNLGHKLVRGETVQNEDIEAAIAQSLVSGASETLTLVNQLKEAQRSIENAQRSREIALVASVAEEVEILCKMPAGLFEQVMPLSLRVGDAIAELYSDINQMLATQQQEVQAAAGKAKRSKSPGKT